MTLEKQIFLYVFSDSNISRKTWINTLNVEPSDHFEIVRVRHNVQYFEKPSQIDIAGPSFVDLDTNKVYPVYSKDFNYHYYFSSMLLLGDSPLSSFLTFSKFSNDSRYDFQILNLPPYLNTDLFDITSDWISNNVSIPLMPFEIDHPTEDNQFLKTSKEALKKYRNLILRNLWYSAYEDLSKLREMSVYQRQSISAGLQKRKDRGEHVGRPCGSKSDSSIKIQALLGILEDSRDFGGSLTNEQVMEKHDITRASFYRYKKLLNQESTDPKYFNLQDFYQKKRQELLNRLSEHY